MVAILLPEWGAVERMDFPSPVSIRMAYKREAVVESAAQPLFQEVEARLLQRVPELAAPSFRKPVNPVVLGLALRGP